jgi:hypothetical protein
MKIHFLKSLLSVTLVLSSVLSLAQKEQTITVQAGMTIKNVLPDSMIYLYPQFLKGSVIFNNGTHNDVVLNYNLLISKIQFIKNTKDTLAVTNPEDVKIFLAGEDTFIYNKAYYRLLTGTTKIILACHQYTKIIEARRQDGYGAAPSTTAVDSYSSVLNTDNSRLYKLRTSAETSFSKCTDYYFTTGVNDFVSATQKNLIKIFPGKADEIKKYVKESDLNFRKKADLEKLVTFVSSLPD